MSIKKPATLKEIAAHAGVGTAAASVVLNGAKSGTRVSEVKREVILRVARELNYRPNGLARSLRMRRTGIVGYFSGYECIDPRNEYIAAIMGGLQAGCASLGLDFLLYTPHVDLSPESVVANLSNGRLDGLIVTARPEHPISSLLAEAHLPVVAIADPLPNIPTVMADSCHGGRLQARHLAERGHKKVLYAPADYPFLSVLDRYECFREEANALGIEVIDGRPVHGYHPEIGRRESRLHPDDLALFERSDAPTAVLAWDDAPAYRIATQLADAGLHVPENVAVVGYNGCIPATEPRWRLSTVRAPWHQVGQTAIRTLHRLIEGEEIPFLTMLPVEMIAGGTS
ncbi:substrate-binding domain-containing protein [soil metagenome]